MTQRRNRRMSFALYISALAVSDTVVLLNGKFNVDLYSLFCSDITWLKIQNLCYACYAFGGVICNYFIVVDINGQHGSKFLL